MNRTFVLPAAIAFSLHAMLFVGSGKPPPPPIVGPAVVKTPPPPDKVVEIQLQEFKDMMDQDKKAANPEEKSGGGNNEDSPISIPEMPSFGPISLSQATQEYIPVNPGKNNKLPTGIASFGPGDGSGPGSGIVGAAFLDNPPTTRRQTPPVYPHAMKAAGVTGTVWVEFVVDENGRVHDVRVVKSTNQAFDDATITAVSTWRFEPGKRKNVPVRFRMSIPILFSLSE